MSIIQDFKAFAMKGNVIDMAVGVVIGGAFGKIVTSLVNDLIMPPLGFLIGGVDFSDLKIVLAAATSEAAEVSINYGNFLQTVIDFLLVAASIFLMIRLMTKGKDFLASKIHIGKTETAAETEQQDTTEKQLPDATTQEQLLTEIRDLLKQNCRGETNEKESID